MKDKVKQPFPKNPPTHQFNVTAKLIADFDRYSNGHLMMTSTDCKIGDGAGNELGSIGFEICGRAILLSVGSRRYEISSLDLFTAFYAAAYALSGEEV